jgi:hypothetical protein
VCSSGRQLNPLQVVRSPNPTLSAINKWDACRSSIPCGRPKPSGPVFANPRGLGMLPIRPGSSAILAPASMRPWSHWVARHAPQVTRASWSASAPFQDFWRVHGARRNVRP